MQDRLPPFELVPPGPMRDLLVDAVLRGVKTATSRLQVMDRMFGTPPEFPGTRMGLLNSSGESVATIVMRSVEQLALSEVGEGVAAAEGDWFDGVPAWRSAHERFWSSYLEAVREYVGDPHWSITDDTIVTVRFFDLETRAEPAS